MNSILTPEQQMIADSLGKLLASEYDFQKRFCALSQKKYFNSQIWQQWSDLGLFAMPLAEEFGGFRANIADMAVVLDVMGRFLVVEPFLDHYLATCCIMEHAPQQVAAALLPEMASGQRRMVLAFPCTGAIEAGGAKRGLAVTTAGANHWMLEGEVRMAYGGDAATDFIVFADDGLGNTLACLLPAAQCTTKNYRLLDDTGACDIQIHQQQVAKEHVFIIPSSGLTELKERAIALLGAEAVGIMAVLNEKTKAYLQQRQQFGQPLSKFQVLQHRLVEMKVQEELARSMVMSLLQSRVWYSETERICHGLHVKLKLNQCAQYVGEQAVQLHGGMGVSEELDVAHYFRRLTHIRHRLGDQIVCLSQLLAHSF